MFRPTSSIGPALLTLVAGLGLAGPAVAQTVPHKERCAGTITTVDLGPHGGTLRFAGTGRATHFGHYAITGSNDFDDQGTVLNGQFTTTAADGSTIAGMYAGTYTPLPSGQVRFDVHVCWVTGTGRLAGVTGEANVVAILDGVAPNAAFQYVTDGTLTFP
jgi:hypothetical protein